MFPPEIALLRGKLSKEVRGLQRSGLKYLPERIRDIICGMRVLGLALCPLLCVLHLKGADVAKDKEARLLKEGVALHDAGKYLEAIAKYEEGLKLNPKSCTLIYEKLYSLSGLKESKKIIELGEKALIEPCKGYRNIMLVLAAAYDDSGNGKRALEIQEALVKEDPADYMAHFNLAISNFRAGKKADAERGLQTAIRLNPFHAGSHLTLGKILFSSGLRAKSLLCFYSFLLFEPAGNRARQVHQILDEYFAEIAREAKKPKSELKVALDSESDEGYAAAEISLHVSAALNEKMQLSTHKAFEKTLSTYLQILGESKPKNPDFYRSHYINFYSALLKSGHFEAFVNSIDAGRSEEAQGWIKTNSERVTLMQQWVKEYRPTEVKMLQPSK